MISLGGIGRNLGPRAQIADRVGPEMARLTIFKIDHPLAARGDAKPQILQPYPTK